MENMKATGIVRRIDDLGRVVIPKEIRRTMRIREGDPLEIYTSRDGEVIFKKYSLLGGVEDFAADLCETMSRSTGSICAVTDRATVIAVAAGGEGGGDPHDVAGADGGRQGRHQGGEGGDAAFPGGVGFPAGKEPQGGKQVSPGQKPGPQGEKHPGAQQGRQRHGADGLRRGEKRGCQRGDRLLSSP